MPEAPKSPTIQKTSPAVPVFAAKNELPPTVLVRERPELEGRSPDRHYEWASLNPDHPSYVGNKLKKQALGDESVGWCTADAWEVVQHANDPALALRNASDDSGKPLDTTVRDRSHILISTTKENAKKYQDVHRAKCKANQEVSRGREQFGDHVSTKRSVVQGENVDINTVLQGA